MTRYNFLPNGDADFTNKTHSLALDGHKKRARQMTDPYYQHEILSISELNRTDFNYII